MPNKKILKVFGNSTIRVLLKGAWDILTSFLPTLAILVLPYVSNISVSLKTFLSKKIAIEYSIYQILLILSALLTFHLFLKYFKKHKKNKANYIPEEDQEITFEQTRALHNLTPTQINIVKEFIDKNAYYRCFKKDDSAIIDLCSKGILTITANRNDELAEYCLNYLVRDYIKKHKQILFVPHLVIGGK